MSKYQFGSIWGRLNRILLNRLGESVEEMEKSLQDLVVEGQLTEEQYANLLIVVNGLIKRGRGEISIADLSQEVREAMTGGSVPVVGEDAVGSINLRDEAVTTGKLHKDAMIKTPTKRVESNLDYIWEAGNHLVNGAENQPTESTSVMTVKRYKSDNIHASGVWILQEIMTINDDLDKYVRVIYANESTNTINYQRNWKKVDDRGAYFFYNSTDYDLDEALEEGNYYITSDVVNKPFDSACTLTVEEYTNGTTYWYTQTATATGGGHRIGRVATRLLRGTGDTMTYKSEWRYHENDDVDDNGPVQNKLKILWIGNSFSLDATEFIHDICAAEGVNATFGVLYVSGGPLSTHWENIQNNNSSYQYYLKNIEYGSVEYTTSGEYTIDQALNSEDWDYVMFNQSSANSGDYSTFEPYLSNLINHVKAVIPDIKVGFMPTWAYFSDFNNPDLNLSHQNRFGKYDNDQMTMYSAILDAYREVMGNHEFDCIAPAGTAIQNARTYEYMNDLEYELTRDGYHLNLVGEYIAGLTLFQALFKKEARSNYKPDSISSKEAYFSRVAANTAINNPFKITEI